MMEGIQTYLSQTGASAAICASDIKDRGYENNMINFFHLNLHLLNHT